MKNENEKNYLDERSNPTKDSASNLSSERQIKSEPEEKTDDSEEVKELRKNENEVLGMMSQKKRKDLTIPMIIGVVILMIIATVVGLYFLKDKKIIGGIKIPGAETEESAQQKILNSSMKEMGNIKTHLFDGNMNINVLVKEETSGSFNFASNMVMTGKTDQSDINNPITDCNLKFDIDVSSEGGSQNFFVDADVMSFGQKKSYFRLNDCDLGVMGMMVGPQIGSFKGNWYLLDMDEMKELADSSTNGDMYDMDMNMERIMDIYSKYQLLEFEKDLGDAKLDDIDTYHYQVKLDGNALVNLYLDVLKEVGVSSEIEDFDDAIIMIEEGVEKYRYVMDEVVNNIKIEVWIGKDDKLVYQTKVNGKFDKGFLEMIENEMIRNGDIEEGDMDLEGADFLFEFDVDFRASGFNEPVEINEPENAKSLLKTLEEMTKASFPGGADSDSDGLSDEMEALYGTDVNNPDTDGDGHSDGDEITNGFDPLLPGEAKIDYDKMFNAI